MTINPTRPELLSTLRYLPSGRIETRDDLQVDINIGLGLNIDKLIRARANAVQGFVEFMQQKRARRARKWSAEVIVRFQQRLESEAPARPYVGAILYWLEKKRRIAQGATYSL